MATVNAPYPAWVAGIDEGSIVSMTRVDDTVTLYTRGGDVAATFEVQGEDDFAIGSIVNTGAFDVGYKDVVVKDWYRAGTTNVKLTNPGSLPTDNSFGCAWTPDGRVLAVIYNASPYLRFYLVQGNQVTFITSASPGVIPAAPLSVAFSPNGRYLAVGHNSAPYVTILKRSFADTFSVLSSAIAVGDRPPTSVVKVAWSPDGNYLAAGHWGTGKLKMYKITYTGGDPDDIDEDPTVTATPITTPSLPTTPVPFDMGWSPNGKHFVYAHNTESPLIRWYRQDGDVFTQLTFPPTFAGSGASNDSVISFNWSPNGRYLAVAGVNTTSPLLYKRSGDYLAYLGTASPDLEGTPGVGEILVRKVEWTPDGKYLIVGSHLTPYVYIYRLVGDALVRVRDYHPETLPPAQVNDIHMAPTGKYMAVSHNSSPYVSVYKTANGPVSGPLTKLELDA